jgi:hypothetical protein
MVAGRFRKRDGRLLDVDFVKARRLEGELTPPAHAVPGHKCPRDVSSPLTPPVGLFNVLEPCKVPIEFGPPVRCPSRRLRAIPKDNLLGQIDEGTQARGHVAASGIVEAISGIRGRPLA